MEAAAASRHRRLRIGALLLRSGLLSADKLAEALEEKERTGERLGEIVVRRGWVKEAQLAKLLADQSDLPFVSLASTPPEARVESLLSSRVAAYFRAVPLRFLDDRTVLVAVSDPMSVSPDELRTAIGLDVRLAVATESEIKAALAQLDASLPPEPRADEAAVGEAEPGSEGDPGDGGPESPLRESASTTDPADPRQVASIVVIVPEPADRPDSLEAHRGEAKGQEQTDPSSTEAPDAPVAIVALPEALRGDLDEGSAGRLERPAESSTVDPGLAPRDLEPPAASVNLAMLEPLPDAPLLRVVGAPTDASTPAPAEAPAESGVATPESAEGPDAEHERASEPGGSVRTDGPSLPLEAESPSDEAQAVLETTETEPREAPAEPDGAAMDEPKAAASRPEPSEAEDETEPEATGHETEPPSATDDPAPPGEDAVESSQLQAGSDEPEAAEETVPIARPDPDALADRLPLVPDVDPHQAMEPAVVAVRHEMPASTAEPALETIEPRLFPALGDGSTETGEAAVVPLVEHRRPQLGTILLRRGLVSAEELAAALEEKEDSGERLGQILVRAGALTEQGLALALAEQHGIDFLDIAATPPNVAVASLLPEKYARRYRAVPVRYLDNGALLVAVSDPTDVLASDDLRLVLGAPIELAVAVGSHIDAVLDRVHADSTVELAGEPAEAEPVDARLASSFRRQGPVEVLEATTNAPAIELVNEVIKHAIQQGASDIHFEPQSDRMLVRARIDGVMRETRIIPSRLQQAIAARLKVMGELDIAERRAPQDGRVTITFGGRPVDLRIAVLPTLHGEQIVIRILYRSANAVDLSELGLASDTEAAIRHAIAQPYGALLSVGPTGSGKTTTLYSALRLLNTEDRCVMTIEDPVEYQLEGLNQVQVNVKAGLTFAHGLRTILRSDPDVLLVGEIRDSETAKIAVQAAMTGHLVLSTLHADNVGSAVSRLADMGVERQLLASTINVIVAQRLARKLCTACREPYELDPSLLVEAGASERLLSGVAPVSLFKARGCNQCMGGYKGRIGLFEALLVTPRMRRLIETATAEEIYEAAVADGMRTLQNDGLRLCLEGLTSLEEVKRVAGERRI